MLTEDGKEAAWCACCRHLIVREPEGWFHFSLDDWCEDCICYGSRLRCDPYRGEPQRMLPPRPAPAGQSQSRGVSARLAGAGEFTAEPLWWISPTGVYTRVFRKRAEENS